MFFFNVGFLVKFLIEFYVFAHGHISLVALKKECSVVTPTPMKATVEGAGMFLTLALGMVYELKIFTLNCIMSHPARAGGK